MSDTVILDGELSLTNQLDGQGGTYNRYNWRGYSAYEIAVQHGFVGTEEEWLASLQGEDGTDGATGPQGEQGVQGPKGDTGEIGPQGPKGDKGDAGEVTQAEFDALSEDVASIVTKAAPVIIDTASGAIASFPDGADNLPMKSLVVDIEPVQDLHGYDHPWPAGGGKNLIPYPYFTDDGTYDGVTYTTAADGKLTASGNTTTGTNFFFVRNISLKAGTYTVSVTGEFSGMALRVYDVVNRVMLSSILSAETVRQKTFTIESDLSAVNIYFNTGNTGVEVSISAYVQLELGSTATAYAPYSNICPITGWTSVNVQRTGKNLFAYDESKATTATNANGEARGIYPLGIFGHTLAFSAVQKDTTASSTTNINIGKLKNGIVTVVSSFITSTTITNRVVTFADDEEAVLVTAYTTVASVTLNIPKYDIQVELGSESTSYEPYTGNTYPISWESEVGTVYGGMLDVVSGELVVDRAMLIKNTSTMDGGNGDQYPTWKNSGIRAIIGNGKNSSNITALLNVGNKIGANTLAISSGYNDNLILPVGVYGKTQDEWKALAMDIQIVADLAEPQTYHLTPTEVITLLGTNNVWADTGDSAVEYRADTELFIRKNTPNVPVEDVQINGTSIVADGVANVPLANKNSFGVQKVNDAYGVASSVNGTTLSINKASNANIKTGTEPYKPIVPSNQHVSAFYSLAKAAGDTTQSQSSNAVGTYTEDAKSAISDMLNGSVSVSGTTPTIVAKSGIRYVCGEVSTLDFTPPTSGICDVVFTSGTTPTVLTVPSTVKWANGFDPSSLDANTTYELNIMDGLGVADAWI